MVQRKCCSETISLKDGQNNLFHWIYRARSRGKEEASSTWFCSGSFNRLVENMQPVDRGENPVGAPKAVCQRVESGSLGAARWAWEGRAPV